MDIHDHARTTRHSPMLRLVPPASQPDPAKPSGGAADRGAAPATHDRTSHRPKARPPAVHRRCRAAEAGSRPALGSGAPLPWSPQTSAVLMQPINPAAADTPPKNT